MSLLINAANLLFVLGFFTTDLLRLRVLSTVATGLVVAYFGLQPEPLLSVVAWNVLFLALNVAQLARLWRDRRPRAGAATP